MFNNDTEAKVKSWSLTGDALAAAKELQALTVAAEEQQKAIKKAARDELDRLESSVNAAIMSLTERISFQVGFPVTPDHESEPHIDLRYVTEHGIAFVYAKDLGQDKIDQSKVA